MSNPRAICGLCGKSRNEHHKERGEGDSYHWYCHHAETGLQGEFQSEPSEAQIVACLRKELPATLDLLILTWKRAHGHEV